MDQRTRFEDPIETTRELDDAAALRIWTCFPGIVQSFDPVLRSAVVQPAIMARLEAQDGTVSFTPLPMLLDVPVVFLCGGGYEFTFPVVKGDEGLVHIADRCIDAWWQQGGVRPQAEFRWHDLSDGVILVGLRSNPRAKAIAPVSMAGPQLRNDAGTAYIEMRGTDINAVTPTNLNATVKGAATVTVTGNCVVNAAKIILNGIDWHHTHVDPQGGQVGPPVTL